ncbi:MAG: malate dehydrogenase, partial [Candidatus Brocadiaceae bacterium]|nr:malate dehydrogenase [Candidatus Brocadiaceae bacterium]
INTKISGKPANDVIADEAWLKEDFIKTVQQRGSAIIKARGLSSAASAANACISAVNRLIHDTPEGETFSMCLASNGEYGVDKNLVFSFPCSVKNGDVKVVESIELGEFGKEKFDATLNELQTERDAVKEMGMI